MTEPQPPPPLLTTIEDRGQCYTNDNISPLFLVLPSSSYYCHPSSGGVAKARKDVFFLHQRVGEGSLGRSRFKVVASSSLVIVEQCRESGRKREVGPIPIHIQ
jgi:hypothetical protein